MARIKQLGVRFSAGEFIQISAAADAAGLTPTAWVRHQALRSLEGKPEPAKHFTCEPTGSAPAKLTHTAGTRFTEEQFEALEAHAIACGLTTTGFIRKVILGVKPVAKIPEARRALGAVNRVGNNLNQLVKLAHSGIVLAPDLMQVLRDVHALFRTLQTRLLRADAGQPDE